MRTGPMLHRTAKRGRRGRARARSPARLARIHPPPAPDGDVAPVPGFARLARIRPPPAPGADSPCGRSRRRRRAGARRRCAWRGPDSWRGNATRRGGGGATARRPVATAPSPSGRQQQIERRRHARSLGGGPVIPLYEWMRRGDACVAPTGWPALSRAPHASRRAWSSVQRCITGFWSVPSAATGCQRARSWPGIHRGARETPPEVRGHDLECEARFSPATRSAPERCCAGERAR